MHGRSTSTFWATASARTAIGRMVTGIRARARRGGEGGGPRDARQEHFDFLGYSFGPHCYRKDGHAYTGASPSRKSVQRLKDRVGELLVPSNTAPWDDVRDRLNQHLRGW